MGKNLFVCFMCYLWLGNMAPNSFLFLFLFFSFRAFLFSSVLMLSYLWDVLRLFGLAMC